MQAALEPRVRCLVADTLGVGIDELAPDVSLTDELAADSLDLAELAARLEAELGLVVPERVLAHLRTYGDLVRAAIAAAPERGAALARIDTPVPVRARLVSPHGELLRAELLTPYVTETIVDQALRAGREARLEITVAEDASDVQLAHGRCRRARSEPPAGEAARGLQRPRVPAEGARHARGPHGAAGGRGRRPGAYGAPRAAADRAPRLGGAEPKRRRRPRLPAPPS